MEDIDIDRTQSAGATNRELTGSLVAAGTRRGFNVITEYPVPGGRLDVVWCTEIVPSVAGIEGPIPVVAFEVESSWRTRKHVKGDLLNILEAGAPVGIIVLAGSDVRDESLLRFARALVERPGPQLHVWTADDVRALAGTPTTVDATTAIDATQASGQAAPSHSLVARSTHTGKYRDLWRWLTTEPDSEVRVTFATIEDQIGIPLPTSCRRHTAHWSSHDGSAVARAIHDAGWRASRVDLEAEAVTLSRIRPFPAERGRPEHRSQI